MLPVLDKAKLFDKAAELRVSPDVNALRAPIVGEVPVSPNVSFSLDVVEELEEKRRKVLEIA